MIRRGPNISLLTATFFLARQLAKCMMIYDTLNWYNYGGYTEMTDPSLNVYSTDEDESKRIIVHEGLSQSCSSNEDKSKQSIVNKTLSQNCYADVDKLCSTDKEISEYTITKKKTQSIRNLQLQRKCRVILTYWNVVGIFYTDLM